MLKKITKLSLILILSIFSFYYTNKSIELIRFQDPIMKSIQSSNEKFQVEAVNATIKDNTIIPGVNGQVVNLTETYSKMKNYGAYNELLITMSEVKPTVSIDDYYDKFIISGAFSKKSIAIVFKVETTYPQELVDLLNNNQILATFFVDPTLINKEVISNFANHEIELLTLSTIDELTFKSTKAYFESLIQKKLKYCYADYDSKEIITLCSTFNMHTILPTIKINSNLLSEVKSKLTNSAIIYVPINSKTISQLPTTINYIKSRGYTFETLEDLLSESVDK